MGEIIVTRETIVKALQVAYQEGVKDGWHLATMNWDWSGGPGELEIDERTIKKAMECVREGGEDLWL
ncbi:MAG: hypothetical protein J6Y02_19875 [Pseudobutyrivibrio sp.]|nr:hypothetical protein [Pseudobutyrivibrio sp.]